MINMNANSDVECVVCGAQLCARDAYVPPTDVILSFKPSAWTEGKLVQVKDVADITEPVLDLFVRCVYCMRVSGVKHEYFMRAVHLINEARRARANSNMAQPKKLDAVLAARKKVEEALATAQVVAQTGRLNGKFASTKKGRERVEEAELALASESLEALKARFNAPRKSKAA